MEFVYKGLRADYQRHLVTDEEVDRNLERLRQQSPQVREIGDRPAENGDTVELDYAGFCGGEQFPGGTAQGQSLTLGSGTFIPGFEEQLLGCRPGEQVTVRVTFPTPYHAPELAGKAAEFRCTVRRVTRQTPWELGDDFARSLGAESLAALREQLRRSLQSYADEQGELDLGDRLLRQAAATLDFTPRPEQMDAAVEEQMETLRAQLSQQNLTLEMYSRFTGKSEAELREDARAEAAQVLRLQAAVDAIARLENLEPTEREIADALADICRRNRVTMAELQAAYDEPFAAAVARSVRTRKVLALLRRCARVEEV